MFSVTTCTGSAPSWITCRGGGRGGWAREAWGRISHCEGHFFATKAACPCHLRRLLPCPAPCPAARTTPATQPGTHPVDALDDGALDALLLRQVVRTARRQHALSHSPLQACRGGGDEQADAACGDAPGQHGRGRGWGQLPAIPLSFPGAPPHTPVAPHTFMDAVMSSSFSPLPRRTPTVRLRDRSPVHVSTMSPMPDRPAKVSGLAPAATAARRAVSARGEGVCGVPGLRAHHPLAHYFR